MNGEPIKTEAVSRTRKPMRRPLGRRILFLFLALFMGLLIGGGAAEIIFRVYLWRNFSTMADREPEPSPNDPNKRVPFSLLIHPNKNRRLAYKMKPNVNCTAVVEYSWIEMPVRTNSLGFRCAEPAKAKPEKTFRILGLGDSSMWGYGLPYEDGYMGVFEEALRRGFGPEWRVEIMNTALLGYNAMSQNEVFKELGLDWGWDLVLQQYDLNDSSLPAFLQIPRDFTKLDHLYLLDLPAYYFGEWWVPQRFVDNPLWQAPTHNIIPVPNGPWYNNLDEIDPSNHDMTGWDNLAAAYGEITRRCRDANLPYLVFLVHNSFGERAPEMDHDPAFDPIRKLLGELEAPYLDVFPYHRKHALEHGLNTQDYWLVPNKDWHPNPLKASIIALALYERVQPIIAAKTGVNAGIDPEKDPARAWLIERIQTQTEEQKKKPRIPTTLEKY